MSTAQATAGGPSRGQRRAGRVILALLAMIAAWLLWQQGQGGPALLTPALPPKAGAELAALAPGDLRPAGGAQSYDAASLHVKINGKADLYLNSGFVSLSAQRFTLDDTPGQWAELLVYDMGSPDGAFAVFSQQRRADGVQLDFAPLAYATENAVFAAWGPWYVEAIGSSDSPKLLAAAGALVANLVAARPGQGELPQELAVLPQAHLLPGSYVLYRSGAFGYRGFLQIFAARYKIQGRPALAFVAPQKDAAAAQKAAADYGAFVLANGGKELPAPEAIPGARLLELLGSYELLLTRGRILGGVHEAEEIADAVALGSELAGRLEKRP